MKGRILILCYLFFDQFYAILASLLNIQFTENDGFSPYVILKAGLGVLSIVYIFVAIVNSKKVKKRTIYTGLVVIFFVTGMLITDLRYSSSLLSRYSTISIVYLLPFFCLLSIVNIEEVSELIEKFIYPFALLFTVFTFFIITINPVSGYDTQSFGGVSYQTSSYLISLNASIILYFFLKKKRKKMESVILIIFFLINAYSVILCGGKGALVGLIISSGFLLVRYRNYKIIIISFSVMIAIALAGRLNFVNTELIDGLNRAVSFIDIKTMRINWDNTSGRNSIYEQALLLIGQKPILGWGIGSSYFTPLGNYPHNLFLEILMDGGVLYFGVWLIVIGMTFKKLLSASNNFGIKLLFLNAFIMAMFSGGYLLGQYSLWMFIYFALISINDHKGKDGRHKDEKDCILY